MVIKIMNEVCLFQLIHVCIRSTLSQFHKPNFRYKYANILLVTGIYRVYAILLIWYYHIIYFPNVCYTRIVGKTQTGKGTHRSSE